MIKNSWIQDQINEKLLNKISQPMENADLQIE